MPKTGVFGSLNLVPPGFKNGSPKYNMPRSNKLKSVGISLDGVHKTIDCPLCDKKHIRSDHFTSHLQTEMKRHDATTALDMWAKFKEGFVCVGNVLVKQEGELFPSGVCFDCNKFIFNKESGQNVFEEHLCKEKKIAASIAAKHAPPTRDTLMKEMFIAIKTGIKMTPKQAEMLKSCREFAIYDEEWSDGYSEAIEEFIRKLCMMAAIPAGEYEKDFKAAFPELADYTFEQIKNHFARLSRTNDRTSHELCNVRAEVEKLENKVEELAAEVTAAKSFEGLFDTERQAKTEYKERVEAQETEILKLRALLRQKQLAWGEVKPEEGEVW